MVSVPVSSSHSLIISSGPTWHFCSLLEHPAQMSYATPQFHIAWISVSGSVLHASHRLSAIICFLDRLTRVGRMHLQARQPNTFILFGNLSFHKVFHTSLPTAPLEPSAQFNSLHAFYASRYPDLTEYTPDFSPRHTTVSGISLKLNTLFHYKIKTYCFTIKDLRLTKHLKERENVEPPQRWY